MLYATLSLLTLILSIIYWYVQYYHHFKGLWSMPTPKFVLPLIGHLLYCTSPQNAYWDLHNTITNLKSKILRGSVGFLFGACVVDPVVLEKLTNNSCTSNKSSVYSYFHPWLGNGLLSGDYVKSQEHRKLLTPAYNIKILEQFIKVFEKNSKILVQNLQKHQGEEKTNIFHYLSLYSLDIICESAIGVPIDAQLQADSEYVQAIHNLSSIYIRRIVNVLKQPDFLYQFTRDYRKEQKYLHTLHSYSMSVIKSRRAELEQEEKCIGIESKEIGIKKLAPFLDILLRASLNGTPMSDDDIREEIDTLMFGGHDTTSAAVSFCIYSIAQYPVIQTKLIGEQRTIFGSHPDRATTFQDIQSMQYLEMVIKETLRLYPSAPVIARSVSKDFTYKDYSFKKGTEIVISIYSLHRHPEHFPNPEAFDPERFTPEEQSKRHRYSYLPFSGGFRSCMGQKFAMLEMKATVGILLRRFVFSKADDSELQLKSGLVLTSMNGVNVRISPRLW